MSNSNYSYGRAQEKLSSAASNSWIQRFLGFGGIGLTSSTTSTAKALASFTRESHAEVFISALDALDVLVISDVQTLGELILRPPARRAQLSDA